MDILGVETKDLDEVLLGVSFGSYLNPESAKIIGLVPPVHVDQIIAVGNSAARGRRSLPASYRERQVAFELPQRIEYIELGPARGLQRRVRLRARLSPPGAGRMSAATALVMCRRAWREVKEIVDRRGWDVDIYGVSALPATSIRRASSTSCGSSCTTCRAAIRNLVVVYGDSGRLKAGAAASKRSERRGCAAPHCYEMFAGEEKVPRGVGRDKPGTFFLTDWLVRNFDRAVIRGLGLEPRPGAQSDGVWKTTRRVMYLRQAPNPRLAGRRTRSRKYLGLPLEIVRRGIG